MKLPVFMGETDTFIYAEWPVINSDPIGLEARRNPRDHGHAAEREGTGPCGVLEL